MLEITWQQQQLQLLPQRAVYWPGLRTLWIADPHFGKDASFRAAGIPVPSGCQQEDLARLGSAVSATGAERLIVLGDFWHALEGRTSATLQALQDWRHAHAALHCVLVRGNHDHGAGDPPDDWRIECLPEMRQGPFQLQHHPPTQPRQATVCGHVHPAFMLGGLRVPCFYFGHQTAILPAFGGFTGMKCVRPQVGEAVYLVTPDAVLAGPSAGRQISE